MVHPFFAIAITSQRQFLLYYKGKQNEIKGQDKNICQVAHSTWLYIEIYGTAHVQVYKLTCVTRHASRNFTCNSCVGLVRHEEYTAREQLLMS